MRSVAANCIDLHRVTQRLSSTVFLAMVAMEGQAHQCRNPTFFFLTTKKTVSMSSKYLEKMNTDLSQYQATPKGIPDQKT
eukprot:3017455-Amphidinium_carterae.1